MSILSSTYENSGSAAPTVSFDGDRNSLFAGVLLGVTIDLETPAANIAKQNEELDERRRRLNCSDAEWRARLAGASSKGSPSGLFLDTEVTVIRL